MWEETGVLATQLARRTRLHGPKRVAITAPGLHPLQRDQGPWSPGERDGATSQVQLVPGIPGRPSPGVGVGEAPAGKPARRPPVFPRRRYLQ